MPKKNKSNNLETSLEVRGEASPSRQDYLKLKRENEELAKLASENRLSFLRIRKQATRALSDLTSEEGEVSQEAVSMTRGYLSALLQGPIEEGCRRRVLDKSPAWQVVHGSVFLTAFYYHTKHFSHDARALLKEYKTVGTEMASEASKTHSQTLAALKTTSTKPASMGEHFWQKASHHMEAVKISTSTVFASSAFRNALGQAAFRTVIQATLFAYLHKNYKQIRDGVEETYLDVESKARSRFGRF